MKFRIFRSAEDQTGAGQAEAAETPRILPQIRTGKTDVSEGRLEDAEPITGPAVVDSPPVGPIKIAARDVGVF